LLKATRVSFNRLWVSGMFDFLSCADDNNGANSIPNSSKNIAGHLMSFIGKGKLKWLMV
jgi:hypothetical protein